MKLITQKHMVYFSVLETMQNIDKNGTWEDFSNQLAEGEVTLEEVKETCLETLERWLEDEPKDRTLNNLYNIMK